MQEAAIGGIIVHHQNRDVIEIGLLAGGAIHPGWSSQACGEVKKKKSLCPPPGTLSTQIRPRP